MTLEQQIGYRFQNTDLLEQALTHKSYHNENPESSRGHNERLEFLGDAVLDLILSDLLLRQYPLVDEGTLSKVRASLVNEAVLAEIAKEFMIHDCLKLGKGEMLSGGSAKPRLLASAFEAFLGAYYVDAGFSAVQPVIEQMFTSRLADLDLVIGYATDFKTRLQEKVQEIHRETPCYRIVKEEGPDHAKLFSVEVFLSNKVLALGQGKSKKQAEQDAARQALEAIL